jgi:replicative DNA helicase
MLREPPHNLEAEQGVLGAILVSNDVFYRVSDWLKDEHFFDPGHAAIYEAMRRMIVGGRRATAPSLKADVAELTFGDTAGAVYLGQLFAAAPPASFAVDFARLVYDTALRRKMIETAEELIAKAGSAAGDVLPDDLIEEAEVALSGLAERGRAQEHQKSATDAAIEAVNLIAAAYQRDGGMAGLSTGLTDLDNLIGGMAPSDLIIAAGRPSMGKTAIAVGVAVHNARRYLETKGTVNEQGCPVGLFTLEMSAQQIMLRLIAGQTGISASRLRRGHIEKHDFDRIVEDVEQHIASLPIHFDEAGGITIAQLTARARRMKRKHGIGLLVVDYLQLLDGSKARRGDRVQEVSEITKGLKTIAKELEIPVLALSQLSRKVEEREDKRPQLSDLRESGSIEQDADVVMFVFREEYYTARREPKPGTASHIEWENDMAKVKGKAELLIEKQRQGPTGTVELHFDAALTKFSNLAHQERLPVEAA